MENNSFIDFDDNLTLNNSEVERYNEVNYQLIGIITKLKDEYIALYRQNNIWISSKGEKFNFLNAKKTGTVVALFYYSDENILILESQQQNNVQSTMNNNNINQFQNQNPFQINNMTNNNNNIN
jgi:hypothetical protein